MALEPPHNLRPEQPVERAIIRVALSNWPGGFYGHLRPVRAEAGSGENVPGMIEVSSRIRRRGRLAGARMSGVELRGHLRLSFPPAVN